MGELSIGSLVARRPESGNTRANGEFVSAKFLPSHPSKLLYKALKGRRGSDLCAALIAHASPP